MISLEVPPLKFSLKWWCFYVDRFSNTSVCVERKNLLCVSSQVLIQERWITMNRWPITFWLHLDMGPPSRKSHFQLISSPKYNWLRVDQSVCDSDLGRFMGSSTIDRYFGELIRWKWYLTPSVNWTVYWNHVNDERDYNRGSFNIKSGGEFPQQPSEIPHQP